MAKERARRRAEREAAAAAEREQREKQRRRREQRAAVAATVTEPADRVRGRLSRWWRRTFPPGDPLRKRRIRRALVLLAILVGVQVVVWIFVPEWSVRFFALLLSLLILPVVNVLLFGRR